MLAWIVQLGYKAGAGAVTPPTPSPSPATPTPAGRSRRRYYVEIDGQQFPVASEHEARQLLNHARAIAERQTEEKGKRVTKALRRKPVVPVVKLAVPEISVSPAIAADVAPLIADIERLYAQAAMAAELRLLLLKQLEAEDDDEDVVLLL